VDVKKMDGEPGGARLSGQKKQCAGFAQSLEVLYRKRVSKVPSKILKFQNRILAKGRESLACSQKRARILAGQYCGGCNSSKMKRKTTRRTGARKRKRVALKGRKKGNESELCSGPASRCERTVL